jgi:hypothetical protein
MSDVLVGLSQCDRSEVNLNDHQKEIQALERLPMSVLEDLLGEAAMACLKCEMGDMNVAQLDEDSRCKFSVAAAVLGAAGAISELDLVPEIESLPV